MNSGNFYVILQLEMGWYGLMNYWKLILIIVLTFKHFKIMEMNYVAPELEVLEVMVEKGFEGSVAPGSGFNPSQPSE